MTQPILIGTRSSALAIAQAEIAVAAIRRAAPDVETRLVLLDTAGDRDQRRPATELEPGAFTTDLESALADRRIDLAVHSAKDLPWRRDRAFPVLAVLRRGDPRDAIVSWHGGLLALPPRARVGTSSPNRVAQLRAVRPDLVAVPVRGAVDRRVALIGQGYDAMLLAAAGLDRLGLGDGIDRLPLRWLVPAPAQAALALQIRAGDAELIELLRRVRHRPTWLAVRAERAFLRAAQPSSDAPVGALAQVRDGRLRLLGLVGDEAGRLFRGRIEGPASRPVRLGKALARRLSPAILAGRAVHVD